jgi:hypothetical protein
MGPTVLGLTWGLWIGSFYPSMPKCSPHFTSTTPPEGRVRTDWGIAVGMALFAAMTAPLMDWIVIGPVPQVGNLEIWPTEERVARVLLAGGTAFAAAFIPYILPPLPVRAMNQLIDIRPTVGPHSAFLSASMRF